MPLFRLVGFATLSCGCLVGRYREVALNREVDYVEEKGNVCWSSDHQRNQVVTSEHATADRTRTPAVAAAAHA